MSLTHAHVKNNDALRDAFLRKFTFADSLTVNSEFYPFFDNTINEDSFDKDEPLIQIENEAIPSASVTITDEDLEFISFSKSRDEWRVGDYKISFNLS